MVAFFLNNLVERKALITALQTIEQFNADSNKPQV